MNIYKVGGAVRDKLLGLPFTDSDDMKSGWISTRKPASARE